MIGRNGFPGGLFHMGFLPHPARRNNGAKDMTPTILPGGAESFVTEGGVTITRTRHATPYEGAIDAYIDGLDSRRGAVFSSNYEYPGRYTRWDTAIIDPPLVISARGRKVEIEALNSRGEAMLPVVTRVVDALDDVTVTAATPRKTSLQVSEPTRTFTEEERSRVPSVKSVRPPARPAELPARDGWTTSRFGWRITNRRSWRPQRPSAPRAQIHFQRLRTGALMPTGCVSTAYPR